MQVILVVDPKEEYTVFDAIEKRIPFIGNYFMISYNEGFKVFHIIADLLKDQRFFELEFNIHHNLKLVII